MESIEIIEKISSFAQSFLLFAIILSVVVFVHELGHFLAARFCKVKVEVFSICFGKAIASFRDRYGTEWRFAWIPLGGYIRMLGDSVDDKQESMSAESAKFAFNSKALWQKAIIVFCGPFANFVFAFIVVSSLVLLNGKAFITTEITEIVPDGIAAKAGLKTGDRILEVNGKIVESLSQLRSAIASSSEMILLIKRPDEPQFNLRLTLGEDNKSIGVLCSNVLRKSMTPKESIVEGATYVYNTSSMMLKSIGRLIFKGDGLHELGGPIKIMQYSGKSAQHGFEGIMMFIALLSLNLGLINLIPIPVLDGGRLFYYAIEGIVRKPIPYKLQMISTRVGLALLFLLMTFSTWNDIKSLRIGFH